MNWAIFKMSYSKSFLMIAFMFGMACIYITPPFQSPDESNHFHRTVAIADGHIMGQQLNGNRLGAFIDKGYLDLTNRYDSIRKSDSPKFNELESEKIINNQKVKVFTDFANVGYYSPTVYAPQVLAVWVSKFFKSDLLNQLYISRIFGFIFWLLIVFYAIKIIPEYKGLFAFLALLPASISINSSLSGDVVSNALSFLWIAMIIKWVKTDIKYSRFSILFMLLVSLIITINKLVYLPLVLLIGLVPPNKIKGRYYTMALMIGVNVIVAILWITYSSDLFIPYDFYDPLFRDEQQLNEGVNPFVQLNYLLSHPLVFSKILIVSFWESAQATWAHYIGKFGWDKNYIPFYGIAILSLVLIYKITIVKIKNKPFLVWQRCYMFVVAILMMLSLSISLYMQWSPVQNDRIWSLSGRYFIPIFPLFMVIIADYSRDRKWRYNPMFFILISMMALILLLISIWIRFY